MGKDPQMLKNMRECHRENILKEMEATPPQRSQGQETGMRRFREQQCEQNRIAREPA